MLASSGCFVDDGAGLPDILGSAQMDHETALVIFGTVAWQCGSTYPDRSYGDPIDRRRIEDCRAHLANSTFRVSRRTVTLTSPG